MPNPSRTPRIIVNADDFGMNADRNSAIVEAFANGVISSTTLMANMPGFDEACELASRHQLSGRIGVHLNLTEGRPLSLPIRSLPTFCDAEGKFLPRRTMFFLSKTEKHAVETEFSAQIQACLDRGIRPTHLDSHQHIHTEWPIGTEVIRVARRFGIGAVRLSRNCGPGIGVLHRLYKLAYNGRLRICGLAKTRYFGSIRDVSSTLATLDNDVEVMVHFTSDDVGNIMNSEAAGIERWVTQDQLRSYA